MTFERTWKLETVLIVGAGLMASLSLGMFINLAVHQFGPAHTAATGKFFNFIIGGISFHGAGLFLTHSFLRQNEESWRNFLGWGMPHLGRFALLGGAVALLLIPITHVLNELAYTILSLFQTAPEVQPTMQVLEISVSLGQRICFGFAAIVVAPLVEEILFRGILYRAIKQTGRPLLALLGSALFFGAIHANLMTLIPLTVLAVVLTLLYEKTQNLLAPIIAHSLFNAINFFMFVLSPK